jgi:hypothetical protein
MERSPDDSGAQALIEVTELEPLSLQNEALIEAGKTMLVGSLDVGRDLCKTMITVCSSAVPLHIALLGFVLGKRPALGIGSGSVALVGPLCYLLGVCAFAYGYFPLLGDISLEDISSITTARNATISHRKQCAIVGIMLFVAGIIATLGAATYFAVR